MSAIEGQNGYGSEETEGQLMTRSGNPRPTRGGAPHHRFRPDRLGQLCYLSLASVAAGRPTKWRRGRLRWNDAIKDFTYSPRKIDLVQIFAISMAGSIAKYLQRT